MRHYPKVAKEPEKDNPVVKASREKTDKTVLYNMTILVQTLRFDSPQIRKLVAQSPDCQITYAALVKVRKPDRYRYNSDMLDIIIDQIVDCFRLAVSLDHQPSSEYIDSQEIQPRAWCGHPRANAQNQDHQCIFFNQLHNDEASAIRRASAFFERRYVYFAFFGKLAGGSLDSSMSIEGSPPGSISPLSPLFVGLSPFGESRHNAFPDASLHISGEVGQRRETAREERRHQKWAEKQRRREERH
ncbi:hypothetical protein ETB97_007788 [Aspergillus alliaceus]|uniref:Uncharacterized protein n=1 Tax=Petromyces alliaceus TaxID=209559 RepID=A0A8H5ZST3_PETAA|nr:hypothetical protein ETB97_007788 [Aspergillus burnettii]